MGRISKAVVDFSGVATSSDKMDNSDVSELLQRLDMAEELYQHYFENGDIEKANAIKSKAESLRVAYIAMGLGPALENRDVEISERILSESTDSSSAVRMGKRQVAEQRRILERAKHIQIGLVKSAKIILVILIAALLIAVLAVRGISP